MNDLAKEHLLHKVLAGSAFAFALFILPVAQHFVHSDAPATETGKVAGVSIDRSDTDLADIPAATASPTAYASAAECYAARDKDLTDLDNWLIGKKQDDLIKYNQSIQVYEDALKTEPASEAAALNKLIDLQYQPYLSKVSKEESVVESQKKEIESRSCPAE